MLIFITITSFSWNNLLEDIKWIKSSKSYFFILSLIRNEIFQKFQLRQVSMGKIHHVLEFYPIISNKQDFIQEKRFWWFFKCPDGWLIFMNVSIANFALSNFNAKIAKSLITLQQISQKWWKLAEIKITICSKICRKQIFDFEKFFRFSCSERSKIEFSASFSPYLAPTF